MNNIQITLSKQDLAPTTFKANNGTKSLAVNCQPKTGETTTGFQPMELLLTALGSCMAIDVLQMLERYREPVANLQVTITAHRSTTIPTVFTAIHLNFEFTGYLNAVKAARAIELSSTKYCPIAQMLDSVEISTSLDIDSQS